MADWNVGIMGLTLRAGDDFAALRRNVNTSHSLVVPTQFVFQLELLARPDVQLDVALTRDCEGLVVGREGVVGYRVVEEVMDF